MIAMWTHSSAAASLGSGRGRAPRNLALYAAKEAGKRTWRLFEPTLQDTMVSRLELRSDLEQALDEEQFAIVYQPIVSLETGEPVGVESLVRWAHPHRGMVSPAEFITIAEQTGLVVPLGAWVLRHSLATAARWPGDRPLNIHVNVSARQLQDPGFVDTVRAALADAGLPAMVLVLELTESLLLNHDHQVSGAIAELKALGVRLAIDDFGTGYSSLGYLRSFPVDILKIDKSFVWALGQPGQEALIDAIVRIATTLKLELVAEGVETTEHRDALRRLCCGHAQGYLFSRPVGGDDVPALLAPRLAVS
jgi:EAL domain-containing protein (putative c-di-GMP-specific phosphodiesterase class I)